MTFIHISKVWAALLIVMLASLLSACSTTDEVADTQYGYGNYIYFNNQSLSQSQAE